MFCISDPINYGHEDSIQRAVTSNDSEGSASEINAKGYAPTAYVFLGLYKEKYQRWGHSLIWARLIGVSPKACRDTVATTLRDADVNERVIGAILGHSPSSSTNLYGSVSMDAKLRALENLMNDMTKGCETQSNKEGFQDPGGMED